VKYLTESEALALDKETPILEQYDSLRIIYGDILRGFSFYEPEKIYIKHFDDLDNISIVRLRQSITDKIKKKGVPTEKERLKIIRADGEWTKLDEDNVEALETNISVNQKELAKAFVPSQKTTLQNAILDWQIQLQQILDNKEGLLGPTAESRALKITNNYYVYYAFYKDHECKEKFWTKEEFEELDEKDLTRYIGVYNEALMCFTERNLRKLSCLPFVLNGASYCKDQGMFFFGKPITEFTTYQLTLFSKAMRNTFVLRETKNGDPPKISMGLSAQALLDWYDTEYSLVMMPGGGTQGASSQTTEDKRGSTTRAVFN
jgi:hypothetical protein